PNTAARTEQSTGRARENGTTQSRRTVSALATVPGARGAKPAPPTVAMASATRVVAETGGLSRGATAPPGRPERLGGGGGDVGAPHLIRRARRRARSLPPRRCARARNAPA